GAIRHEKQLDVEGESNGVRLFENRPTNIQPERFETALGVPKRHSSRQPDDQIENAAGLLAPPGLMNTDQFAIERARTKSNINLTVGDRSDQLRDFAERRR